MKKLISMMLMLCAVITFSACSSDDDPTPTSPITNYTVPTSAKVGSEVTIQGKGFTEKQTFFISQKGTTFEIEQIYPTVTSNGITFTIPYTFTNGDLIVTVNDGTSDWTLGTITLLPADNPVSACTVPSEMAANADMSLTGIGFAEGDALLVVPVEVDSDDNRGSYKCTSTITADGISCDASSYTYEGDCNIYLQRGENQWLLGKTYLYIPKQIESISVADNYMIQQYATIMELTEDAAKLTLHYNEDGTLSNITTNYNGHWEFTYSGKTVTVKNYTYTLDDQNRIASCQFVDTNENNKTYTWSYDANGYLESVKGSSEKDVNLIPTYKDNNLSAYNLTGNNSFTTDKSIHSSGTVEPIYLLNTFSWILTREDLFLGFLLNQNVKISSYVPTQWEAYEKTNNVEKTVTANIETSFKDNALTMKTSGTYVSEFQGYFGNSVVVTYKNK